MPELVLENDRVSLRVLPELGGKISSLVSRRTDREWLWTNPVLERRSGLYGESYIEFHDTGGIDECLPNVDACKLPEQAGPWQGIALPDHGELFHQCWQVLESSTESISLQARGVRLPYTLRRVIELTHKGALLRYRLDNLSPHALPFTWCIHPIFDVEPDMQIGLATGTPVRVAATGGHSPFQSGDQFVWPVLADGTDLSKIPDSTQPGYFAKLFAGPISQDGFVSLSHWAETLRFRFDGDVIPSVAMWWNFGGWHGAGDENYYNLALEPAIGDADSLAEALTRGGACWVEPGEQAHWQLEIELD